MRLVLLLIMALVSVTFAVEPTTQPTLPPTQSMDLFLLIGQSNMAGRGKIEPQDQVINPHIWKLDQADHWVPAVDPLHFDKPKVAGVGLGSSFAREIAERYPDRYIGLIPCAVGGTAISEWKPGSPIYTETLRRCRIGMEHGRLRAILWHQGESDATAAHVPTYLASLKELIAHLRADLNANDVPLIVGQIGTFHEKKSPFTHQLNLELNRVSTVIPRSACASSRDLTHLGDNTHFDAPSLREFGQRYATEYLRMTTTPTTKPAK